MSFHEVHVIPVVNDEADLLHDCLNLGIGVFLCVHSFVYCLLCEPVDPEEERISEYKNLFLKYEPSITACGNLFRYKFLPMFGNFSVRVDLMAIRGIDAPLLLVFQPLSVF